MDRRIYQNNRDEDKYLEVIEYKCHHFYAVQFMKWGTIINKLGSRTGRRGRWRKESLDYILEDYHEVKPFEIRLVHKGGIWQHAAG